MFTVLIAEKEHIDAIRQENKLFFEPFLESKELAFCSWNPEGQSLQDAVPGLYDAVGRTKNWRAVIINNCTPETSKQRNPFDVVEYSALRELAEPNRQIQQSDNPAEWISSWETYFNTLSLTKEAIYKKALEFPLQKLSTWLCFKPEDYIHNEVHAKLDVQDWALEEILKEDENKKNVGRLELLERDHYKNEARLKEILRRDFVSETYLNVSYPSEVYCISTRSAENNYFDPNAFWLVHQDNEYSSFADRNMYFDKMRFLVFDILSSSHRDFRSDYIRFLATVLIFISNPVPGGAMQARRLYQLEVDSSDDPLCTIVTSYDKKLSNTYAVIESEMEQIRGEIPGELTDKTAEALFCTPRDIDVLLDKSCDPEKILAELDYGLFYDSPENEFHKWNRDYNESQETLSYIVKQQSRSVRKSVKYADLASEVSDVNISRLTPLQIEDVREYTDNAEDEMVASIPKDLAEFEGYSKRLSEASEDVKKQIARRMTQKTGIILTAICLGLFLLCFFPFLFANHSTPLTVSTAIALCASTIGVLAVIMFVSLFFLRSSVVNAVRGFNDVAHEITNEIHASLKGFSKYLSAFCNVRRGYSVQNYAKQNLDVYTKSIRIRKRHQEDIRKMRAHLKEKYSDYIAGQSFCDEAMSRPYDYDFDETKEHSYPAPFLAGDRRQIEFISAGNHVSVPSSFITKISVKMEEIYE